MDNIIEKKFVILKPKLKENKAQLSDRKKGNFGFDLSDSVIDVEQCGYAISGKQDILYTYGIEPCCGLILYDENVRVLFHLDGSVTPEDVIEITNNIGLLPNTTALFAPGVSCDMPGSFQYKKLEDEYRKIGYKVLEQRIPSTFGFVTVGYDQITIGTGINRSLDRSFAIEHKKSKVETQRLGKETLEEIKDSAFLETLKTEMAKQNELLISNGDKEII